MQRWIDVRLLAAIVMLSEELNFTRAAKRLGITQSGLSRRVQELEKKHRIKLFERNNANVTLTEAGRVFVEEARLSLLHNERAMQAARAATEGQESILTIGRSPYADPFLTSALLSIHLPLYPNLKVSLHSDFAPELVHSLLVGKLDMALVANPGPNRKLTTSKVSEAPLYVILPDNSPIAEKDVVTLADLAEETWILFERKAHPGVYDSILRRAEEEEIVIRDGQKVLTRFGESGCCLRIHGGCTQGATARCHSAALADRELQLQVCLASRAENRSKLVSEFARAFMRRISQVKKPPQSVPDPLEMDRKIYGFRGGRTSETA